MLAEVELAAVVVSNVAVVVPIVVFVSAVAKQAVAVGRSDSGGRQFVEG